MIIIIIIIMVIIVAAVVHIIIIITTIKERSARISQTTTSKRSHVCAYTGGRCSVKNLLGTSEKKTLAKKRMQVCQLFPSPNLSRDFQARETAVGTRKPNSVKY